MGRFIFRVFNATRLGSMDLELDLGAQVVKSSQPLEFTQDFSLEDKAHIVLKALKKVSMPGVQESRGGLLPSDPQLVSTIPVSLSSCPYFWHSLRQGASCLEEDLSLLLCEEKVENLVGVLPGPARVLRLVRARAPAFEQPPHCILAPRGIPLGLEPPFPRPPRHSPRRPRHTPRPRGATPPPH